jgi:hypothetical protein
MKNNKKQEDEISRKEAISKIGNYGKYAALTALGTYLILNPLKAQATSGSAFPDGLGAGDPGF